MADVDGRQRVIPDCGADALHRLVGCADAALRRMRRTWLVCRLGPPRVDADAAVTWNREPQDAVGAIRSIRVGRMGVRANAVKKRIGRVGKMGERRVSIDVVERRPCPERSSLAVDQADLMGGSIENHLRHPDLIASNLERCYAGTSRSIAVQQ